MRRWTIITVEHILNGCVQAKTPVGIIERDKTMARIETSFFFFSCFIKVDTNRGGLQRKACCSWSILPTVSMQWVYALAE